MKILLNILGIAIYFINRYANRDQKQRPFDYRYWIKDNWPEMATVLITDIVLMILLFSPGTEINFDEILGALPIGIKVSGSLLMSFLLGLGLSSMFYKFFKVKTDAKIT